MMQSSRFLCSLALAAASGCAGTSPLVIQWEYTGGPYARNVSTLVPSSRRTPVLFAGLDNGEVHRSTDGGRTWTKQATIRPGALVYGLHEDPETPDRIYAATAAGAYVSPNEGKDWTPVPVVGEIPCRIFAFDPWKPTVIFVGSRGHGVYSTTDRGMSWSPAISGSEPRFSVTDVHDIVIDPGQPDLVYAAAFPLGVMKSTDGGQTWTRITPDYSASVGVAITHLLVHSRKPGTLLFGTNAGALEKTTDGGVTWSPVRAPSEAGRILSLASDPSDPDVVLAGTESGYVRSANFGTTWNSAGSKLPALPTSVAFAGGSSRTLYAFGEGIGIQVSFDGGISWEASDRGLGGASIKSIVSDRSGSIVYAVVGQTILRHDAETPWRPASTGIRGSAVHALVFTADSSSSLVAATPIGLFRTTDEGESWRQTSRRLSIIPLFLDTHPWIRTRIFTAGEQGIFVSTDRGESWGQAKPVGTKFIIRSLTYAPTNAGVIYGATPDGLISSTNGGFSWDAARFGMDSQDLQAVTLDPDDPQTTFVWTTGGSAFRSTNGGLEWNRYGSPWPDNLPVRIAVDRYTPSSAVALVGGLALYHTANGGGTWRLLQSTSARLDVSTLHWNAASSVLYAGTVDKGVYRMPLGGALREYLGDPAADVPGM